MAAVFDAVSVVDQATVVLRDVRLSDYVGVTEDVSVELRALRLYVNHYDRITVTDTPTLRPNKLVVRASETVNADDSPLNHGAAGELGPSPTPLVIGPDYWTVGI